MKLFYQVLPDLLHTVRTCDDFLKEYITWKLGTLVSIVRQVHILCLSLLMLTHYLKILYILILHVQHIRKYLPDLFSLISELWSSFSLPAANRPVHGAPVNKLVSVQLWYIVNACSWQIDA